MIIKKRIQLTIELDLLKDSNTDFPEKLTDKQIKSLTKKDFLLMTSINPEEMPKILRWAFSAHNKLGELVYHQPFITTKEIGIYVDKENQHDSTQELRPRLERIGWQLIKKPLSSKTKSWSWFLIRIQPVNEAANDSEFDA